IRQLLREKTSACGRCRNKCLRHQPSIGIWREKKIARLPAHCLSESQDIAAVVDGGRLRGMIAVGCQVESSQIRAPAEEMSSLAIGGLVGSDDGCSRIIPTAELGKFRITVAMPFLNTVAIA